jgi:hypothetical protein
MVMGKLFALIWRFGNEIANLVSMIKLSLQDIQIN